SEEVKHRYRLSSDYALADKLGIAQPEANLIRRGLKVPKPELCIKVARLLDKNPVELLLIAQKDKAPAQAKEYWTLALTAVDVMLHVPKKGEALYPSYLLANQAAVRRNVVLRRLLILSQAQMGHASLVADAIQIMDDQHRAGIKIYYAFREELSRSPAFHRLEQDFKKYGAAEEINSAMFDEEILIFSQLYDQVPLGMVGKPTP